MKRFWMVCILLAAGCQAADEPEQSPDMGTLPDVSVSDDAGTQPDLAQTDLGTRDDMATVQDLGGTEDMGTSDMEMPACDPAPRTFHLIGDSTVASGSGWGDGLPDHLIAGITVSNEAVSGSSSKSFWESGYFEDTRAAMTDGDFLFIQFGHNDIKDDPDRFTDPGTAPDYVGSFRDFLQAYHADAQVAGATPVIVTSISRMTFGSDGVHRRTHGDYPDAARKFAEDYDLPLLDLEQYSHEVFNALGEDETLRLYAEEGGDDRTHFPPEKASAVAELVRDLMAESPTFECYVAP